MIPRVTELSEPPVVGRFYLVPTVTYPWSDYGAQAWPIFLPLHSDEQFLNFPHEHYHIDARFLDRTSWRQVERAAASYVFHKTNVLEVLQAVPVGARRDGPDIREATVIFRQRQCRRPAPDYQFGDRPPIQGIRAHFAGQQAPRNRCGWVCPHQHFPMGSLKPDADGVLTCPLHGLRVQAETGQVLA